MLIKPRERRDVIKQDFIINVKLPFFTLDTVRWSISHDQQTVGENFIILQWQVVICSSPLITPVIMLLLLLQ